MLLRPCYRCVTSLSRILPRAGPLFSIWTANDIYLKNYSWHESPPIVPCRLRIMVGQRSHLNKELLKLTLLLRAFLGKLCVESLITDW